ncbi:MAG: hypothetical protein RL540_592 [Actinomycetota bacterium]
MWKPIQRHFGLCARSLWVNNLETVRRIGSKAALLALSLLFISAPIASAHPELINYIDTSATIHTKGSQLFLDYYVAKSDMYAFPDLAQANSGLEKYSEGECNQLIGGLLIQVGDIEVDLKKRFATAIEEMPTTGAGLWIWCRFKSDIDFYGAVDFKFQDSNFQDIPGYREFNIGLSTSLSIDLTNFDNVQELLSQKNSSFSINFPEEGSEPDPVESEELAEVVLEEEIEEVASKVQIESVEEKSWLTKLADRFFRAINPSPLIVFFGILISLLLGALHSIAPGHGKSIMAVLALAERGKRSEIYRLGVTMGATHTVGVLILGAFFIAGSALVPTSAIPLLGLISGSLISAIGLFYLIRHFRHLSDHLSGKEHHHHEVKNQRIAVLGIVGGMVPTPTALTVLVGTAALGSAWYGVLLVLSYGIGMTTVLIFTGQILARAYQYLERSAEPGKRTAKILELAPVGAASIQVLAGFFLVTISYGALT